MRGLYAHAPQRMHDDVTAALQARWEKFLRQRATIDPRSPVPLPDILLTPFRATAAEHPEPSGPTDPCGADRSSPEGLDRGPGRADKKDDVARHKKPTRRIWSDIKPTISLVGWHLSRALRRELL